MTNRDVSFTRSAGLELNAIADKYYEPNDSARKSIAYFAEYERILAPHRNDPITIIELGVWNGASLLSWRDYLPNATIVGIDQAKEAPPAIRGERRLHFVSGLQDDPDVLARAVQIAGAMPLLVLDDCSHIARVTKRSFFYLFPYVTPGGSYVIEDIGTSFLHELFDEGQIFREPPTVDLDPNIIEFPSHINGLVGFAKQLVDHSQRAVATRTPLTIPIERVTFIGNMAIVDKAR
jgi:hypothetical protein